MQKVELLSRIQELSSILSSQTTQKYMSDESVADLHKALEAMTEEYVSRYCAA